MNDFLMNIQEDVESDVYSKVSDRVENLIKEMTLHLNNKNRGEILRDGYKISIIVNFSIVDISLIFYERGHQMQERAV